MDKLRKYYKMNVGGEGLGVDEFTCSFCSCFKVLEVEVITPFRYDRPADFSTSFLSLGI